MDPRLLSLLPDAAKLGILRHLGAHAGGPTQQLHPPPAQQQQQQQQQQQPCASPPPHQQHEPSGGAGNRGTAPTLLVGRRLQGGLAVVDGILDATCIKAARVEARTLLRAQGRDTGMVGTSGAGLQGQGSTWASPSTRGDQAAWLSPGALETGGHRQLAAAVQALLSLRPWLEQQGCDVGGRPSVQLACYPGGGTRYVRHRDASASVPYRSITAILYLNADWEAAHGGNLCVYNHSTVGSDPCTASPADLRLAAGGSQLAAGHGSGGAGASVAGGTAARESRAVSGAEARLGAGAAAATAAASEEQQQHDDHQRMQRELGGGPRICSGLDEGHPATVVPPLGGRLVVMDSRLLHEVQPAQAERFAVTVWFSRKPPPAAAAAGPPAPPAVAVAEAAAGSPAPAAAAATAAAAALPAPAAAPVAAVAETDRSAVESPAGAQEQHRQQQHREEQAAAFDRAVPRQQALPGPHATAIGCPGGTTIGSPGGASCAGSIFVSIPAYRDSEAQWTLADLFAKAAHPERVHVGIVWQVRLPQDDEMVRLAGDQRWLGQVRQVVLPASQATGPCKARALAQQLWEGEEFHLQIDSHMRFVPGWDSALLRMLRQAEAAAGHPRVVLSTYPAGYEGEGPHAALPADPLPSVLCASHWGEGDGLLRLRGRKLREPVAAPLPALFWAAGFSFSRARLISEAPYPRDLPWLFFGEEMLQLQRMWCAGWDVFTPPSAVAFHLWSRKHRPTFQEVQPADVQQLRRRSQQRVAAVLAGDDAGKGAGGNGDEDGSREGSGGGGAGGCGGTQQQQGRRSLEQFWHHVGVDFRPGSKSISEQARNGGLPAEAFLSLDG